MEPASSGRRTNILAWCLEHQVSELIIFDSPSDEYKAFIDNKVNWINVGRRAIRQPELTIRFYGEIREQ